MKSSRLANHVLNLIFLSIGVLIFIVVLTNGRFW